MPINPIKEQRISNKKYIIGYYSKNPEFREKLKMSLTSEQLPYEVVDLSELDTDTLKIYLSIADEVIFDKSVPDDLSNILKNLKLFIRIISIEDIEKITDFIKERSNPVLELKKEKTFENEKDLRFIMQIVSILENKDPYTKDHSARVAKYSLAIAEEFFSSQYDDLYGTTTTKDSEEYERFKHNYVVQKMNLTMLSAWAHDIGKNSIAQSLLSKDSKLTGDEYDIIKMHADFGATMIRKLLGNEELAEIIENHHERIDGHGYHNLTEFSDISKIIAIADAFDSMTTARSYTTKIDDVPSKSKLRTVEEAINELQVSSHEYFDLDENRISHQLDTRLTDILVKILKKELSLLKENKNEGILLLTGGLDEKGFLKAGFWDDLTQEYVKDSSVSNSSPRFLK